MALNDDYLSCKSYEGKEVDPVNEGFTLFQDTKSGKYHFALVGNSNKVLLRSEGYTDISSRNKGIAAVIKNKIEAKRFSIIEDGGKFFIILKAGNHKEIGRSCEFKTKSAAESGLDAFSKTDNKQLKAVEKKATSKKEVETKPKVEKAAPKKESKVAKSIKKEVIAPVEKQAQDTSKAATTIVSPISTESTLDSLQDFLNIDQYLDRPRIWDSYGITGYVKFQAENGKHYFGVYNPDATLYLRSQGFESEEDRDSSFDLMDSIILLEENYKIENLNGRYYAILFEENDIVAISPDFSSFIEAFVTTPGGRPREVSGSMY